MFYGNATNTTNIAFLFDRIYETRYAMEQSIYGNDALGIKRDYIAPGRYVLVSYGYDKKINNANGTVTTDDDFIRVYSNAINQDSVGKTNSIGNIDGTYFSQETGTFFSSNDCDPDSIIKLATFTPVMNPSENDLDLYYFERNGFYYKAHHYYENETYYTTNMNKNSLFVAKGQIVRRVANNIPANEQVIVQWEYRPTTDSVINREKDYYVYSALTNNYLKVTSPSNANITSYFERKNPTLLYTTNTRRNGYTELFYICTGAVSNSQESDYTEGYYRYLQLLGSGANALAGAAAFKPIALFTSIDDPYSQDYMDAYKEYTTPYLEHYNVDYAHFYAIDKTWGTLHRGYDATVWLKVISEGVERYILIAHLNSLFPGIEVVLEPPTTEPISPFIGAESTDMVARLHILTPWGFEVKSYDTSSMTPEEIEQAHFPSDETTVVKRFVYNPIYEEDPETHQLVIVGYETDENDGTLIHATDSAGKYRIEEVELPAYIYYNKAGLNKKIHSDESDLSNHIKLTPTGKSLAYDSKYATSDLKKKLGATADIQLLDISLPAIGNMVSNGYDLIYGDGQEPGNTEHKRHLDTLWYNASETSFIEQGDSSVYSGGKTFDLNTLAGSLNTYHNRLGLIIEPLDDETWPQNLNDYEALNSNYIYEYKGKYYKRGYSYSSKSLSYAYYQCNFKPTNDVLINADKTYYYVTGGQFTVVNNPVAAQLPNYYEWYNEVNEDSWASGTYYIETDANDDDSKKIHARIEYLNVSKYLIPYRPDDFSAGVTYYKRVLKNSSWFEEYDVVPYAPNQYYYKSGQSYILEQENTPQPGEAIHYHIVETDSRQFTDVYAPNKFWVYDPFTGNYIKAEEDEANPNQTYYNIKMYGTTFWDDPTGQLTNTPTQGRSFLPYLGGFYYFIVNINGADFPVVDTNTIPGHPDAYKKTTDTYIHSNTTYYTYNSSTETYTEVTTPIVENLNNYYVKVIPDTYYFYKLGDEPTLGMTTDGLLIVTYLVESSHEINTLAFGETRTINGITYTPGISPMYYLNEDGDFIRITMEFLKSRDETFFDLDYNEGRYGGCWFIEPVDRTGDIFIPNVYWARIDGENVNGITYTLATQALYESLNFSIFYSITPYKVIQDSKNGFYEAGKYFYKEYPLQDYEPLLSDSENPVMESVSTNDVITYNNSHEFGESLDAVGKLHYYYIKGNYYPPDWLSDNPSENAYYLIKGKYYKKAAIAIESDATGEAPPYYRWLAEYELVPWKFNLITLDKTPALVELQGFNNGASSINGLLLTLHNLLSLEDEYTRDTTTVLGALNLIEDKFYTLGEFIPGRIIYVNNYGRLTSSSLTHASLVNLLERSRDYVDHANNYEVVTLVNETGGYISVTHTPIGTLTLNGYAGAANAAAAITAGDTVNSAFGKILKSLDILNSNSSTIGSVDNKVTTAITNLIDGAPSSLDTLKELADWIGADDLHGASKTLADINTKLTLGTHLVNGLNVQYNTVKDYVEAYVSDSVSSGVSSVHVFANESLLDTYDLTNANITDAVNKKHEHNNKSELDLIQSGDVGKWNAKQDAIAANTYDSYGSASAALTAAETYADGLASNYDAAGAATTAEQNAKSYADGLASNYEVAGAAAAITGENTDDKTHLTLYGLLAYIEELELRIITLENASEPEPSPEPEP